MFRKASHPSVTANFQNTFVLNLFNFSQKYICYTLCTNIKEIKLDKPYKIEELVAKYNNM